MKKTVLFLALCSLLFASCRTIVEYETKAGLSLQLSTEGEFTKPIYTKAVDDVVVDVNDFKLVIAKASTGETMMSYNAYRDVPSVISIEPGVYNLYANSPGTAPVAWFQPIYRGSAENVSVSAGKAQNVSIVCKLANMKVTVRVTDEFVNEMMSDFEITVSNEDGFLTWDKASTEGGYSGYYSVKPLTLDIKAIRKTTGDHISHHLDITEVAAQDHHILTIDASETGDIEFGEDGITVDYTVNNKEENIVIDGLVDTPLDPIDPEQPDQPTDPVEPDEPTDPVEPDEPVEPEYEYIKITCPGVEEPAVFSAANMPAEIDFTLVVEAEKGIEKMLMNVESQNLKTMLEGVQDPEYPLAPVDMASMTGPQLEFWGGLFGITDPTTEIKGKTTYSLPVGGFIPMMLIAGGTGDYLMSVEFTDAEGHSKKVFINIIINE